MTFLEQLKDYFISIRKNINTNFDDCGYYNTIIQHLEDMKTILDDCNSHNVSFDYHCDEESWDNGCLTIYLYKKDHGNYWDNCLNYIYEIQFNYDERYWGYCQCTPEDEGYNPIHRCCGAGCDWVAPAILIQKKERVSCFSFNGYERDMWKLEEQWNGVDNAYKEKLKQDEMKRIEEQIQELIKRKHMIENE